MASITSIRSWLTSCGSPKKCSPRFWSETMTPLFRSSSRRPGWRQRRRRPLEHSRGRHSGGILSIQAWPRQAWRKTKQPLQGTNKWHNTITNRCQLCRGSWGHYHMCVCLTCHPWIASLSRVTSKFTEVSNLVMGGSLRIESTLWCSIWTKPWSTMLITVAKTTMSPTS